MYNTNPVFIPGPTNIPEELRRAVDMPTIDHRSSLFPDILQGALAGVRQILKSQDASVVVFPATGTGGWESAICNTLSPGDRVLAGRNGMFSHKWIDMCQRHGLDMSIIDSAWGSPLSPQAYQDILEADTNHSIKAVLATHNETATGVTSDIAAIRAALDAAGHPAMLFVDGVSSIGSIDFQMDAWGVDIAVTGSQKGFMLPAGLAIVGVSAKAQAAIEQAKLPRTFFDMRDMLSGYETRGYPYTPAVGLLNGLRAACTLLIDEGLENVFARHARIADGVRAAVEAWQMPFCAHSPECRSNTVTAIMVPEGFDANLVLQHAWQKYRVSFGGGLGQVAGKLFRIGHLGSMSEAMALSGVAVAEMAMRDAGLPVTLGQGVAAAQAVYQRG